MSFHDLSSMITEIRSTIPRVQLIQSTSYKTDLSHRSTTKTTHRSHLQLIAYHLTDQRLTLLGYCAPLYIGSEHGLHSRGPFTKAHIKPVTVSPTHSLSPNPAWN